MSQGRGMMLVKFDYLYFTCTDGQEGNMAMWAREKLLRNMWLCMAFCTDIS